MTKFKEIIVWKLLDALCAILVFSISGFLVIETEFGEDLFDLSIYIVNYIITVLCADVSDIFLFSIIDFFYTALFSLGQLIPFGVLIFFLVLLYFLNGEILKKINIIAFAIFNFVFLYYLLILFTQSYNSSCQFYSFISLYSNSQWSITISLGIDNFNIFFIILTAFLFPLCVLINWNMAAEDLRLFLALCILLEIFLIMAFSTTNLLVFFFCFEATLIPMYFIISLWGSRERKIHASYYFFIYTAAGSIFILCAILLLYDYYHTLDVKIMCNSRMDWERELLIFIFLFVGFAVKVPIPPFHLWLPEAHVEASTPGSVVLAGILLKLGTYGMLRFLLPTCPEVSIVAKTYIYIICSFVVLYISCMAVRQTDLKKIIAYSSIGHMAFVIIALFSFSIEGIAGAVYLMISHGIISAALFASIGILYERTKTREIIYYRNVSESMPLFSLFFFVFILANIGFPFTSGFISEFIILNSLAETNIIVLLIFLLSTFFTSVYSIWLYARIIFFVNPLTKIREAISLLDINKREFYTLSYPLILIILLGLFPNIILSKLQVISAFYLLKIFN